MLCPRLPLFHNPSTLHLDNNLPTATHTWGHTHKLALIRRGTHYPSSHLSHTTVCMFSNMPFLCAGQASVCIALMYTSYVLQQRINPFLVLRPLEGLGMTPEQLIARVDEFKAAEALRRKSVREARKQSSTARRVSRGIRTSSDGGTSPRMAPEGPTVRLAKEAGVSLADDTLVCYFSGILTACCTKLTEVQRHAVLPR